MSKPQAVIDAGELNMLAGVCKKTRLGSLIFGRSAGLSVVSEDLPVASNVATATYTVLEVLECCVYGGSAGNGGKSKPGAGVASAANSLNITGANATLTFFAGEVTGASARVRVLYITSDTTPKADSSGDIVPLTAADTNWAV